MKKKFILTLIAVSMTICALGLAACNKNSGETQSDGGESSAPAIEFVEENVGLLIGETKQLTLVSLEDGETVTYSSTDENVVTVSVDGLLEGISSGTAVVKATTSLGRSALVQVTVYDPSSYPVPYITVSQDSVRLFAGDTFKLSYSYSYLGQALDGGVEMTSDSESVAVVENGVIRAVGAGTANVLLKGSSSYGEATRTVRVTVSENQVEFYPSFLGKDIYEDRPVSLTMFVKDNGEVKTLDNVIFTVSDVEIAAIEDGVLIPLLGGETTVTSTFEYEGQSYTKELPIRVFGKRTCSFTYIDGTEDHALQAYYGDVIPLEIENTDGNPEYKKAIKCWYVNGEEVTDDSFVMPDEDVEISVRFINQTGDNFEDRFATGHLLNNLPAEMTYMQEQFVDSDGNSSDLNGYMRFFTNNWASLNYTFDEPVIVSEYSTISMRIYVPSETALLYFGVATEEIHDDQNVHPTKRYEASPVGSSSGDVPCAALAANKWVVLEMPLSAFVSVGAELDGISMAASATYKSGQHTGGGDFYIDYISVNYGLAATDPTYQDNAFCKAIQAEENGSAAQATAIREYYRWLLGISDEQRETQVHQENVAKIRSIINENFNGEISVADKNQPKVSGCEYKGERIQTGWGGHHTKYKSESYETYVYLTQFNTGTFDGSLSFNAVDYATYTKTYFGLYINSTQTAGKIAIGTESFSFDATKEHYFKVVIQNGVLSVLDDSMGAIDGGATVFTAPLSSEILSGEEALRIDFEFDAWTAVENTEIRFNLSAEDIV